MKDKSTPPSDEPFLCTSIQALVEAQDGGGSERDCGEGGSEDVKTAAHGGLIVWVELPADRRIIKERRSGNCLICIFFSEPL